MADGDGAVGNAYHFKTVEGPASTAVVQAVAFVSGRDPLDLEPLGRVVETTALDRLIENTDSTTVAFHYEGFAVQVSGRGDIHVEADDEGPPSGVDLERSNVLLLDGPGEAADCSDHLGAVGVDETNVLAVTFSPDAEQLDAWQTGPPPDSNAAVISVGDVARSSADVRSSFAEGGAPAVETVADPGDLAALEAKIAEQLDAWEREGDLALVCFDSVTSLLEHVGRGRTIEFLRSMTERTRGTRTSAHFHLDAESYDGEFAESASTLFDAVVTVKEDGRWVVEPAPNE